MVKKMPQSIECGHYAAKTAGLTAAVFETILFRLFMALLFGQIRIHYKDYYLSRIEYK